MVNIIDYKDAILRYLLVETEEQGTSHLEVIYNDVENKTNVPKRFVGEILDILQNDGFIRDVLFYVGDRQADVTVNYVTAYEFVGMGGYKAKQLINAANLEKLDLELQKLQNEVGQDDFKKATTIAELAANISTIVTSIKSFFP